MVATKLHPNAIAAISHGNHGDPSSILGPHHHDDDTVTICVFRPSAQELYLQIDGEEMPMEAENNKGFFSITIHADNLPENRYRLREVNFQQEEIVFDDPYRFQDDLFLSDYDIHLHGEGRHWEIYEKLGAHPRTIDGVSGINFAVWAPNAMRISVIGDFNRWDGRVHPMIRRGDSGIHELFIPDVALKTRYKYEIRSHHRGYFAEKVDPYGFYAERRPATASITYDVNQYTWSDDDWMRARAEKDHLKQPMVIYEMHLGSWRRNPEDNSWLTYGETADQLIPYLKEMGYTHIELLPVAEHPFDGSWGYQVTGYYAPTSRFGEPDDFKAFVDRLHQNNIGVIVDWVPAHFPKDGHALNYFDGTHLYAHEDSRLGEHPDWGTMIFNYGRNEVRNFLIANALFWLDKYHIDGLRVDAVSSMVYLNFSREDGEWLPNEYGGNENLAAVDFLKEMNRVLHEKYPGAVTIAEESTAWPMVSRPTYLGGLGFTFKWNMGWMHDTLSYMSKDPVYRRYEHNKLTFSLMYAFSENFVLSFSHDEVVHGKGSLIGKMPGDWWKKFAQLRLLFGYQYTHPGKKLNFMGSEIGQWSEWSESRSLDWHLLELPAHEQLNKWVRDLNALYRTEPALYEVDFDYSGFQWIEANDSDNSVYSYVRFAADQNEFIVVVGNFTPVPRRGYRIGVPSPGFYREMINSDAEVYGGSNVGNLGGVYAEPEESHGFAYSLDLTLPPLGIVVLKLQ